MRKTARLQLFCALACILLLVVFSAPARGDLESDMISDLQKVRDTYAASEPRRGDFSSDAGFDSARDKWLKDFQRASDKVRSDYKKLDGRFDEIGKAIKDAGLEKDFMNSGSRPKNPSSDIDLTEMKPGGAKKLADQLNSKGYSLRPDPDVPGRYVDPAKKLVVWETPPNLRTGSPEWRRWVASRAGAEDTFSTSGGLFETSGGKVGIKDPEGAVLDNIKKAMEAGIGRNPAEPGMDSKTIGKSVKKAMEWTGTTPKKGPAAEFAKQAESLRNGRSWEEAGVTSPSDPPDVKNKKIQDWLNKAQDSLAKSHAKAQRQSAKITDQKVEQLTEILNKKQPWSKADQKTWRKLTDELHTTSRGNAETLRNIAEKAPELGGKITNQKIRVNPDGTVTDLGTGKTMTRSQFADKTAPGARKTTPKAVKPELPKKPAAPMPPPQSKIVKYGGGALLVYQGYEAIKAYWDYLDKEARENPENFGYLTVGKGIGYGVATFFGIPGLIEMGQRVGLETREQYLKDLKAGKKWLLPPAVWAGGYAAWEFGKSITIGPLIAGGEAVYEGFGLAGDLLNARKAAQNAAEMGKRLDAAYKPLSDLMSHVIGGPLPPIWEKNRSKYWKIFKPILDDKEAYDRLMKSPAGTDLKKWARDYAHKRARELGITFGSPGADNPDDNDNIGEALLALPPQERGLFLAAAEKGDAFVMDFILSRDRDAFPGPFDPETLGAYRSASLSGETAEFGATLTPEQKDAVMEVYGDLLGRLAATPRVAILSSGYARGAAALMGGAEPAALLRPEEAPRGLSNFRLLIVPSGSLSDWYLSESLKAAIDEFVSSGGTVMAFSQQLGKEYSVLPGKVGALGFAEDQSCQYASARITSGAGAFCSMNTPTPDFNVDGYFLDYPLESEVWLTRTKNDQPCMISYPYGKGRVVLSTLYMDWAAGNHQGTAHERLFFRDLTAFLLSDAPISRADSGRITVNVPAPDDGEGRGVFTPLLIGPDGEEIALPEGAAAGGTVNLPQGSAPGFYRLGGVFTDPSGKIAGRALPGIRFALSVLPESLSAGEGGGGGISASAASDLENYIRGAEAKFSILLWNRGSEAKRVRVDWRFPHNIQAAGADRGRYQGSSTVVVGPGARETLPVTITVVNTDGIDRLWANAYDDATGEQLAAFSKGFYTKNPSTEVKMAFPAEGASPGKPVGGTVYFKNPFGARGTCTLRLKATDPSGKIVETERAFEAGEGEVSASFELALPEDAFSGECVVQAFVSLKGSIIGVGSGRVFYTGDSKPLKGKVVDRITGSPVPGCEVALHLGETAFSAVSGEDGGFALDAPDGRFSVEASSGDHNYYTAESLIGPPDRDGFTIALTPSGKGEGSGTVAGRVLDRISGETYQGCRIDFVKGGETYTVTSDASGGYSIALPPGDYIARCFIEGKSWNTAEFPVRVTEGWDQPLDLYVPLGKVRLRVLDRISGKEAEGVTALLKTVQTSDNEGWNRDVSFAVNGGPAALTAPGRRELRLSAPGYATAETEIFAGEREAETVLWLMPDRGGVRVVCRDLVSGEPLEGAAISVGRPDQAPSEVKTADARGESFFSISEGRWSIGADLHGYAPAGTECYSTPHPAGADPEVTIYLRRDTQKNPGTAKISVLDLLSGKPVPDVLATPASPEGFVSGKTGGDGMVSLELPDGRVALKFEKEGYAALETELFNSYLDESVKVFYLDPAKAAASFTVRDHFSGKELKGARVSRLDGQNAHDLGAAGEDGTLETELPRGRQALRFGLEGYRTLDTEFYISGNGDGVQAGEEVYLYPLTPPHPFRCVVKDPDGNPVPSVSVTLKSGDRTLTLITGRDGGFSAPAGEGPLELAFSAKGYHELKTQSWFSFSSQPTDPEEYRLFPSDAPYPAGPGRIEFSVRDALTGEPLKTFSAYLLDNGWARYEDGRAATEAAPGNRNTAIRAPRYKETGSFFPTAFPGFTVKRTIRLHPSAGGLEFSVKDGQTGRPLGKFSAYLLDNGWAGYEDGKAETEAEPGNKNTAIRAPGYYETGSFYPTTFPGRAVARTIFMQPSAGRVEFSVKDAVTGGPVGTFQAYLLDNGWARYEGGRAETEAAPGNKNTIIRASGYNETGSFYPAAFPGRTVARTVYLLPSSGRAEFWVKDAVTGEPLKEFQAYLLDNGWARYEDGRAATEAAPGNKNTLIRAPGYNETGNFYPAAFPGRTVAGTVFLQPAEGKISFRVADANTGNPLPSFSAYLVDNGWARYEGGAASSSSGAGNKNTVIRADGYSEEQFYPGVFPGRTAEHSVFLHPREPAGQLNISCVDVATGKKVAGAILRPQGEKDIPASDGTATHTSATHYKQQWFRASAPGYREADGPGFFIAGRRDISLVIPMEKVMAPGRGDLLATVADAGGKPIPGAAAALSCSGNIVRGRTNKSGQILFRNVPSGVHTLSASSKGYSGGSARVAVGGRETARAGLSLEPLSSPGRRAPFDVEIVSVPSDETLKPGEKKTLRVLLANRGGEGGRAYCSLELPDVGRMVREVILEAGERAEVPFEVAMPEDSVNSQIPAVVRVGEKSKKWLLTVRAPVFTMTARTDKEAYLEGETLEVEVAVASEEASGEYQVRVGFNDESRVENIKLEGGKGRAVFSNIPVAFRGNRLLYGLYHPTGRSVLLNALPVRDRSAAVLMLPDRQQYNAGETVKLKIIGKPGEVFQVSSPLIKGRAAGEEGVIEALANSDGEAFIETALPGGLATGVYPFRCGEFSEEVDVRGLEARILDRRLEEDPESGGLRLYWRAESSAEIPCRWTVEALPPDGEPYALGEGDIRIKGSLGDYSVPVEPDDDRACDFLLRLGAGSGGEPLAVIRYSWSGAEE